jgi:thymidylate synthase (FAD)
MSNVKIVAITKPLIKIEDKELSAEDLLVYVARVSNPSNQLNLNTGAKLLGHCIDHKHWSVFDQAYLTVEIQTSLAISSQILRHKSMNFQQFSRRYSAETVDFELHDARRQDFKNRQNSIADMSNADIQWFHDTQNKVNSEAQKLYEEAISKGIAKELARMLLPVSTKTSLYMSGSLRSFLHYVQVRTDPSTQKEHRDVALGVKKILVEHFPVTSEALGWIV